MQTSNVENAISFKPQPLDIQQWKNIIADWEASQESQKKLLSPLGYQLQYFQLCTQ